MGSPFGPTFSNYYMSHIENNIFQLTQKPNLYLRYVDDIFIRASNTNEVENLRKLFQQHSVLNFTVELNENNKIPFLDVLVDSNTDQFTTSLYKKPTSLNSCTLNYKSECPKRYKTAVVRNLLQRAHLISSSRMLFLKELINIKRTLINNGFPNSLVDHEISVFLADSSSNSSINPTQPSKKSIDLFYCNQFHQNYNQDESVIKSIIKQCTSPVDPESKIKLIIYYRKFKTANLVIRNAPSLNKSHVRLTNVVYKFTCPLGGSIPYHPNVHNYVGHTETSLSRRLSCHLTDEHSAIFKHLKCHVNNVTPLRDVVVKNTVVLYRESCKKRLLLLEALVIKDEMPVLNRIRFNKGLRILDVFAN